MRSFMLAGEGRDLETAHSLLAMDADAQEIDSLLRDPVLFDGFQDLKVDRWMVYAPPDSDRGKLTGSLAYRGGFTGKFDADLVQGKEGWRISRLSLVVSRDKLQQYQPGETPVPGGTPGARQGRPAGG